MSRNQMINSYGKLIDHFEEIIIGKYLFRLFHAAYIPPHLLSHEVGLIGSFKFGSMVFIQAAVLV
ncbi:hypothetical protein [Bacillus sp. mrc49]|uniref:hypothetical protein n=1 Tax=Bacillus sp. mrc49 TaxID=2054913 RepID=UPI000C275EE5|nr:hypothetical protein [Bacillus sp. mrc49]PJN90259.1 hypothetical protein CVN76_10955 [Bacillus sp. mrc49]